MIRLLGWGDGAVSPRAAAARGFVPRLEALDGRVLPSVTVAGVKGEFALDPRPGIVAPPSTESPPADANGANGLTRAVHLAGSGDSGFDPVVDTWGEGKKVKIDFCVADPGTAAQMSTVPAVSLVAPAGPDGANGGAALVHVSGRGVAGFDRDSLFEQNSFNTTGRAVVLRGDKWVEY